MVAETVVAPVAFLAIYSSDRIRMDLYPQTKQSPDDENCSTITDVLPRFGMSIFLKPLRIRLNCIHYPSELIFKITNYMPNSHTHKQFLLCLVYKCSKRYHILEYYSWSTNIQKSSWVDLISPFTRLSTCIPNEFCQHKNSASSNHFVTTLHFKWNMNSLYFCKQAF